MSTGILGFLMQPPAPPPPEQFYWWKGYSGQSWITTIYPLFSSFPPNSAVYLMVRRNADGTRSPIYIGQTGDLRRRMAEHSEGKLVNAYGLGANELHAHFLATSEIARFAIETDLRNGNATPINEQPSSAVGGLFGLGRALLEPNRASFLDRLSGAR